MLEIRVPAERMITVKASAFDRMWSDCQSDVLKAIQRVGASGRYVLGSEGIRFEDRFASYSDQAHAVGCASGLDALEIALRLAGVGAGDTVLTSPLSAFATALAILRLGAQPVFCDVDQHGLIDPEAAVGAFADHPQIRAIVPVHLYGHLADMAALRALADAHGAALIEDAAQAVGASRDGLSPGALGEAACYSFYPTKNLGCLGDGGALTLAMSEQATRARALRDYGQSAKYVHDEIGLNSRLDELHAATLTDAFLPRLDGWLARRRQIAKRYLAEISSEAITLLPGPEPASGGWHLFPVLTRPGQRDAFLAHLKAHGIGAGLHYPTLICDQKAYVDAHGASDPSQFAQSRRFAETEVSLPIHPYLKEHEVDHVVASVNAWDG